MNRAALEHILRAAAAIADERDFVVIGSQAVLGQFPHAPDALLVSIEADIYPRQAPAKSDLIDGAIGELSRGVAAPNLPKAWREDDEIGTIIGAFIVNGAKSWLTVTFPEFWLYFLGALFIAVTLWMPQGVVGLVKKIRGARA